VCLFLFAIDAPNYVVKLDKNRRSAHKHVALPANLQRTVLRIRSLFGEILRDVLLSLLE